MCIRDRGLAGGLAFGFTWLFFFTRSYFYLYQSILGFFKPYSLAKNPHLKDGVIYFPLPGVQKKFQKEAFDTPEKGQRFSQFLFKRRRLQKQLAWYVRLASVAGQWKSQRCISRVLKEFPEIDKDAVRQEDRSLFINLSRQVIQLPTLDWLPQIEITRLQLLDFEQETNIRRRVKYFKAFREALDKLYDFATQQPYGWGQYFVKALELWQKSASEKLRDLEIEAATEEPIAENIYRGGEKLKPEDRELFLGRSDLRDAFKNRVLTAAQMPLFFIQGQRRVGKSSLIAFLPTILDRGFKVVSFDMQEHPGLPLPALLLQWQQRIHETLGVQPAAPPESEPAPAAAAPENTAQTWIAAWQAFRTDLDAIAQTQEARIVLAIDEYEELHRILQSDPVAGGQLLGAMRAWSQGQNRAVLLFAGADFLSELRSPNWSEYFVQAERLFVDYLDRTDALKLINLVGLKYPPTLLETMYLDTLGHPCLLQKICREIVTIVNKTGRESRAVTEADYQEALRRALLMPDDGVVNIFWNQFCEYRGLKPTVRQILQNERPTDERAVLVLEDHGFIVPAGGGWRMRVPLFDLWLRRYQVT